MAIKQTNILKLGCLAFIKNQKCHVTLWKTTYLLKWHLVTLIEPSLKCHILFERPLFKTVFSSFFSLHNFHNKIRNFQTSFVLLFLFVPLATLTLFCLQLEKNASPLALCKIYFFLYFVRHNVKISQVSYLFSWLRCFLICQQRSCYCF